jgi:crotonobetainyl-CoA:carnitine CoA-transferase CaiB-like acyl-CoA transferase
VTRAPLAGLRVLDAAVLYAAPLLSAMLAGQGADVVKLEPPGGDSYRGTSLWALVARGKRSLVLDLDTADGRARLHALIPNIDVVVVNESENRLGRRGLDHGTLSALSPGLVYVHVTGYGLDGPYAGRPANGTIAEAFTGLTHLTGRPDAEPVLPSVPLGDAVTAYAGAFGVLTACWERAVHGPVGRVVDVNLTEAMLQVLGPVFAGYDGQGPPPGRMGSGMPGALLRGVFATADSRWVAISLSTPRQLATLAAHVGGGALADAPSAAVEDAVRAWILERGRAQVVEDLDAVRVPVAPVNDARDVLDDPHVAGRGMLRTVHGSDGVQVRVPGAAPRVVGAPVAGDRLPDLGEHTADVLAGWSAR